MVASRILPNRSRYDFSGKARQKFHQKLTIFDDSKMSIQFCNAFLGLSSSISHLGMVKHYKFDHDLDMIFWDF